MPAKKETSFTKKKNGNGATLGFEQKLWGMADGLRGHMDAAEYKQVALGLILAARRGRICLLGTGNCLILKSIRSWKEKKVKFLGWLMALFIECWKIC